MAEVQEFLRLMISGINIIPTGLVLLTLVYWCIAIIGVFDLDGLDFDFDFDVEGSAFHLLHFLNIGNVPSTTYFSILFLNFWALNIAVSLTTGSQGGIPNIIGILPCFVGAALITKIMTNPFRGMMKGLNTTADESKEFVGMSGILKFGIKRGKTSQVIIDNGSTLINCFIDDDIELEKGTKVLVIEKDSEKNKYLIKPFQE